MRRNAWERTVVLLLAFIGIVLLAPVFAPHNPIGDTLVSATNYKSPTLAHPMGTDGVDRDLLSRVLYGSQTSAIVGVSAVILMLGVGVPFGIIAGMRGGRVDAIMMRIVDVCLSVPRFLVLLAVTSITDTRFTLPPLILLIGLTGWFDIARLTRGEVAGLMSRDWLLASRAAGTGSLRLVTHQIFPHLLPMIVVMATIGVGRAVVLEAGLSFLGAGTSHLSLGNLMQDGLSAMGSRWWLAVFPGLALVLIVLACNALGDALRDVFAPEQVHAWPTT